MSVSFESAIETLKVMFPEWDDEMLSTLLISNDYHVERTIENILVMSGDTSVQAESSTPAVSNNGPVPAPAAAPRRAPSYAPTGGRYRGVKCNLPDDFLRPPGTKQGNRIVADEELALMLQNELFQKEARKLLGEDFPADSSGRGGAERQDSGAANDQTISQQLSSMGAAAKRNLSNLALRFSSGASLSQAQNRHNPNQQRGANARRASGGRDSFRALDDEEGMEVITFNGGSRNKHVLDDVGDDSENPLIQYNQKITNNLSLAGKKDK